MHLNLDSLETPIALRPAVTLTDEELMRFSEENRPYKIERNKEGEITIMTPVGGIGGTHEAYVSAALFNWNEKDRSGITLGPNAGFNLPDGSCLAPDGAWLPMASWNGLTPAEQAGFPPLCPDFIIEVRSRTDSRSLLEAKMQLWLDNGARLAWLIDPTNNNITIYKPGTTPETLDRPELVSAAPILSFELPCNRLWSPL